MNKKLLLTIEIEAHQISSHLDTDFNDKLLWKYKINNHLAETLGELLEKCGLREEDKKLISEKIKKIKIWFNHEVSESFTIYEIKTKPIKLNRKQTYLEYDDQD